MYPRTYVNGVIATKEKYFLGEKLLRLCEMDGAAALRTLRENGFGGTLAAENASVDDFIRAEEMEINEFIRLYAGTDAEKEYFLAPLDTHNVKAYFKASILKTDVAPLLSEEGLIPIDTIASCFESGEFSFLPEYLQNAVQTAQTVCLEGVVGRGAEVGAVFEKALYSHLKKVCKNERALKEMLAKKADYTNLVTALRSKSFDEAKEAFLDGGKVAHTWYACLFDTEGEQGDEKQKKAEVALWDVYKQCKEAGSSGVAERAAAAAEIEYFAAKKYALEGKQPFLYYVLRKKAECFNVRMILVCQNIGLKESEMKKRLRGVN